MLKTILLGLLALVVLAVCVLLFTPVRVFLRYRHEELTVWAKVLWIKRVDLYPPKKAKKQKPEEKPEAPPSPKAGAKGGGAQRVMDMLTMVSDLLPVLGESLGYMLRRITLRQCDIAMVVGKEEAADTAIQVGRIYALGYNAYGVLCSFIRVRAFHLHVTPDYIHETQQAAADLCLSARPSSLLMGGLLFLAKGGTKVLRTLLPQKPGKKSRKAKGKTSNNVKVGA